MTSPPAFDINPNPDLRSARATSIVGAANIHDEVDGLMSLADACRLTATAARTRLGALSSTVASNWRSVARRSGIVDAEVRRFAPIFARAAELAASSA